MKWEYNVVRHVPGADICCLQSARLAVWHTHIISLTVGSSKCTMKETRNKFIIIVWTEASCARLPTSTLCLDFFSGSMGW